MLLLNSFEITNDPLFDQNKKHISTALVESSIFTCTDFFQDLCCATYTSYLYILTDKQKHNCTLYYFLH